MFNAILTLLKQLVVFIAGFILTFFGVVLSSMTLYIIGVGLAFTSLSYGCYQALTTITGISSLFAVFASGIFGVAITAILVVYFTN